MSFFKYGESNWYFCDQDRFRKRLAAVYEQGLDSDEATPGFVCFSFMTLALGSHFQHLLDVSQTQLSDSCKGKNRLLGGGYFRVAERLLPQVIKSVSIEGVQATLLMALLLLPTGHRASSHSFIGLSLRMAVALSLHRLVASTNSLMEETKRVFWTVWALDRWEPRCLIANYLY